MPLSTCADPAPHPCPSACRLPPAPLSQSTKTSSKQTWDDARAAAWNQWRATVDWPARTAAAAKDAAASTYNAAAGAAAGAANAAGSAGKV